MFQRNFYIISTLQLTKYRVYFFKSHACQKRVLENLVGVGGVLEKYQVLFYGEDRRQPLYLLVVDKINNKSKMDPRPYHFDYRRPRLNNPTYESANLFQSIRQRANNSNPQHPISQSQLYPYPYPSHPSVPPQQTPQSLQRHQSSDLYTNHKIMESSRYGSKSKREPNQLSSSLSQYGTHLVQDRHVLDQNTVFEKQEKDFSIISYHPKTYTPRLKNFPRLTLQHKLISKFGPTSLQ